MGNSSICIKQQIKPNSNSASSASLGISSTDTLAHNHKKMRGKNLNKDFM